MNNNVIVDTGCANLASVKFAIKRLGFKVIISDNIKQIQQADRVILPGVGSAKQAMKNIIEKKLHTCIQQLTQPVLGFCLGMQLMAKTSSETNAKTAVNCLNLIPTKIEPLQAQGLRLPHMGWNTLSQVGEHPIFSGIKTGDYFYFVHSFAAPINDYTIASCEYGTHFSAAIAKNNFIGCQFHPERSGKQGSMIIENFLTLPELLLLNNNQAEQQSETNA
jgi:glutamine amidotransferase